MTGAAVPTWSRRRLIGLLVVGIAAGVAVVVGLVLAVVFTIGPASPSRPGSTSSSSGPSVGSSTSEPAPEPGSGRKSAGERRGEVSRAEAEARDALAERRMQQVPESYARPRPLSSRDPGAPLELPQPRRVGAAGVPTGFPHTPAGAMAQMIAIEQTAMQSGSLPGVREVIRAWAAPGGPTPDTWSGVEAMAGLLTSAGLSGAGSPSLSIVMTPAMGLIKGRVGPDFVVPCVDYLFEVTLNQTARAAVADCQRMVWVGNRWMLGPGDEPVSAPSVWPNTDEAMDVGYRDLRFREPGDEADDETDDGADGEAGRG